MRMEGRHCLVHCAPLEPPTAQGTEHWPDGSMREQTKVPTKKLAVSVWPLPKDPVFDFHSF